MGNMGECWIDPQAEFVFVKREDELPMDAEAFDVPNVRFSHHGGHCSFYAILHFHELVDPILHRIARIIDEADTVQQVKLEPAATGLDLICEGLRLISKDDMEAIDRGRLVYDALYSRLHQENSGAAVGSLLVPGLLEAQEKPEATPNAFATSGLVTRQLKPLKHTEIPGFLSSYLIAIGQFPTRLANAKYPPIVVTAIRIPKKNDGQKLKPVLLASANGTKNGKPRGTRIRVSRPSPVMTAMSRCDCHVITKAKILTIGSDSNSPPARGDRPAISDTATITTAEMRILTR